MVKKVILRKVGFNGGRSQLNFNFLQTSGEYPFINHLKTAQTWILVDNSGNPSPALMSANGYPTTIANGGVYTVFFIPSSTERPGNWRLRWTGTATLDVTGLGNTGSQVNGSFTWAPGNVRIVLKIVAGTNLTNVEMFHADDETLLDSGMVFNTLFKQKLTSAKIGVLRFLNWQYNNTTNARKWADRKPLAYAYYDGHELRGDIYAGSTTNSGDDYSASAPSGWTGLVDKAMVTVLFNASASGTTPTLNINGTGAKTIRGPYGDELFSTEKPLITKYGTLVYDADLDVWLKWGGATSGASSYLVNGVPPEICLRLCSEVGAHPWFCPPFLSCDPITDWITGLATYCRDYMPTWMIPRFEAEPNESWNSSSGFYATRYGWSKAFDHWGVLAGSFDINDWVGKVASLQGQAVSAVYSDNRARYQSIVGVQTFGSLTPTARLESTLYVSQDGGSAAFNWATHVCCATYHRDTYTDAQRGTAAIAYDGGDLTQPGLLVASGTSNTPADSQHQFSLPAVAIRYAAFKSWAAGLGVNGLAAYEGGWSPDYVSFSVGGATSTQINALYRASKDVTGLAALTTTNYQNFVSAGGGFPSCFQLGGTDNVWSVFDPDVYATPSTQWGAIVSFNA